VREANGTVYLRVFGALRASFIVAPTVVVTVTEPLME
jgi:hypothetical protein